MNSMKDILTAFDNAENIKPKHINESTTVNISVTGDSSSDIRDILKMLSDSDVNQADDEPEQYVTGVGDPVPDAEMGPDGEQELGIVSTLPVTTDDLEKTDEEYVNSPCEEYQDVDDVVNRPSDDLNKSKKSYPRAEPGDNPMNAKHESLKQELSRALKEHLADLEKRS